MPGLAATLEEAGGAGAPRSTQAALRRAVLAELARGAQELGRPRSGYDEPLAVALAAGGAALLAALPVDAALRADPRAVPDRAWTVAAAAVGALVDAAGAPSPSRAADLTLTAGAWDGRLVLALPVPAAEDELAALAVLGFDERVAGVDRLRIAGVAVPGHVLEAVADLRPPVGAAHPLRVAEAVARLGGDPADPGSVAAHEDAVLALLEPPGAATRPHEDPDPARRVARRILQRLDGMGKWGGYHTEWAHLARGFAGNDRALAGEVGEALLAAGLLAEKPSVGQRHVYLNPRRAGDIRTLIDGGEAPSDLRLPKA
jgi:hypothetical protein